jgi:hypothetical protein
MAKETLILAWPRRQRRFANPVCCDSTAFDHSIDRVLCAAALYKSQAACHSQCRSPSCRRAQPASDLLGLPRYTTRKLSSGHATLEKFLNDQLVKTVAKSLPKIGELTERDWVIGQYFSQEWYFL